MRKQQIIPNPLTLNVHYPQSFRELINNKHYQQERMFVGYGNPSAQLLIVGQEVTWNKEEQKEQAKQQAEATKKSIEKRCPLLKEPFFQDFPVKIFACGGYSNEIFPYLYGFEKKNFKPKGWFSTYKQDSKLYVCTWQFSAPLISDTMLQELANIIRRHLKQE